MGNWYDETLLAVREIVNRNQSPYLTYKEIKEKKLADIVLNTQTKGKTPENSLSLYLQRIRDDGLLKFVNNKGLYFFIDSDLDKSFVSDGKFDIINANVLGDVITAEAMHQSKIRKGQSSLRIKMLENYNCKCCFCEIREEALLMASHIF